MPTGLALPAAWPWHAMQLTSQPVTAKAAEVAAKQGTAKVIPYHYTGVLNAVKTIVREEGFLSLYQGLTPAILGNAASWGLYFALSVPSTSSIATGGALRPRAELAPGERERERERERGKGRDGGREAVRGKAQSGREKEQRS